MIVKLTSYLIKVIDNETKLYFRHMDLRSRTFKLLHVFRLIYRLTLYNLRAFLQ